ncbi:RNA binding domain-containing protein [Amniculicola lignicola CBS 123094]|uniref:RNA binding domain-containing protein n=1 Tax=Amniculicola lignicola CBS 123094 TaxID=1392246 RepID=A0A6A5WHE5_9PLEO|nr:RNA binding domain-containing protein [Amniculicola lignicola CBS 123094]
MFLLRRTAARAINSTPSRALFVKPRCITTLTSTSFRARPQQWALSSFQKRFASDDVTKSEIETAAKDEFAQTAAEAPVDETITPVPEAPQASSTDASKTVGIDALESALGGAGTPSFAASRHLTSPNNTLYVGNLYYEVTEEQIKRVFSRFGSVNSVKLVYDNRGMSRGFAYIEYTTVADAQAAIDNLDSQVFEGRNLVVQFHKPRKPQNKYEDGEFKPHAPSKTLFIGNMSFEMSDADLNDLFREIRNVLDVRVAIDRRTGQPRGFAHADFIDVASATRARDILAEKVILGRQLRVDFSQSSTRPSYNGLGGGDRGDRVQS